MTRGTERSHNGQINSVWPDIASPEAISNDSNRVCPTDNRIRAGVRLRPRSRRDFRGRASTKLDADVDESFFATDGQLHGVTGLASFDRLAKVGDRTNFLAIDRDDQVGRTAVQSFEDERTTALAQQSRPAHAGTFGRAIGRDAFDQQAFIRFEHSLDTDLGTEDSTVCDQVGHNARYQIDRNRKADAGALPGASMRMIAMSFGGS